MSEGYVDCAEHSTDIFSLNPHDNLINGSNYQFADK